MPFPSYSFIPFIVDSFLFIPVAKITFVASYSAFIVVTLKFFSLLICTTSSSIISTPILFACSIPIL